MHTSRFSKATLPYKNLHCENTPDSQLWALRDDIRFFKGNGKWQRASSPKRGIHVCHWGSLLEGDECSSPQQLRLDHRHCLLVIWRGEQVAVAFHGHLDRGVTCEGHDLLDREALLDPELHGEVAQVVPAHRDLDLF